MSLEGHVEKRSRCCGAPLRYEMSSCGFSCGDSWPVCSQCGKGRWPDGCKWDHVYIPSDYEKALEHRISALEKLVAKLKGAEPKDPYDTPEYQAFVESMVPHCHCEPFERRPCDGVLAGGLCDRAKGGYDDEDEQQIP